MLPAVDSAGVAKERDAETDEAALLTRSELKQRERESIRTALVQTKGKVFGPGGAAELLDMKGTTLASRIKALGLKREMNFRRGNEFTIYDLRVSSYTAWPTGSRTGSSQMNALFLRLLTRRFPFERVAPCPVKNHKDFAQVDEGASHHCS